MKHSHREKIFEGKILHFNISPKGVYEGIMVESDKGVVQVNFSPEAGAYIGKHFSEGKKVSLTVLPEPESAKGKDSHPVYDLVRFKGVGKQDIHLHQGEEPVSVKGKVIRLNYALHGEMNGALLDNGDFVHFKPHGAKAIRLSVGQELEVKGETSPSFIDHRVIEAEKVNGINIHEHKPKRKHA